MTLTDRTQRPRNPLALPAINYEPAAHPLRGGMPTTTLHRHRLQPQPSTIDQQPPTGATEFAHHALRQALEVIDRRRPLNQLRVLMSPHLVDVIATLAAVPHTSPATLRRVSLRSVTHPATAEVFASYTRGARVRAIAARAELRTDRWYLTALHIG